MINHSKLGNQVLFYLTDNIPCYKYEGKDLYVSYRNYINGSGYDQPEFEKLNAV